MQHQRCCKPSIEIEVQVGELVIFKGERMENQNKIKIIKPTLTDLDVVVNVETAAWPDIGDGMVAECEKFKTRIELGLMYLLYFDSKPAGIISYQYPSFTDSGVLSQLFKLYKNSDRMLSWDFVSDEFGLPINWYEATNNGNIQNCENSTNSFDSDCAFLIGVGVDETLKGKGLVNHLIAHTLSELKIQGIKYVIGYGRLPQMCENGVSSLEGAEQHLLKKKPGTNLPWDYGARFHVLNGAEAIAVIPNAMDDPESKHYGFLALYKL